ncbi:MAG: 2-amino-4-hydroxy-6-hydroxymethyldihydropteridine diphosphokinase [Flavobacteriales bacterium TMED123]|nr:MAG: 2-amino-4-hydroxy-6-hydroxymethyldihydropteridine diphosphokinase [Flavobacteriales bacterium TMED123]
MNTIFLQLGSNMGEREAYLQTAIALIAEEIGSIQKRSKVYESVPWGVENQNNYLNQVIQIKSDFSAEDVLEKVLQIEHKIGRIRNEKWGERIIDIDILFFNDLIIEKEGICIPHIHLHNRKFVLIPLNEIGTNFMHPKYNKTISELLINCKDIESVEEYAI